MEETHNEPHMRNPIWRRKQKNKQIDDENIFKQK